MITGYDAGSEASNYEYVIARVRSRRAVLFDDDDYRKLVRMGQGEIARFMEETEYEEEMNELGARYSGIDLVEYALNRNLAKHFEDLLRWASGQLYVDIVRYLHKFDAWNVKTVIRGVYSGADRSAIEADLIQAGELDEDVIESLLQAETIEDVVERLDGTMFGEPMAAAYEEYEQEGLLVPLENAVDRAFYSTLMADLPAGTEGPAALFAEFLTAEIDFRNLRNALRLARSGADVAPTEYFIEGGNLFDEDEVRQLVANHDQLVEHVRDSSYGDDLSDALRALEEADSLIEFEHALDLAELEYASRMSNRYPLSVCPVFAYILAKEREVENVRAIARGREAGLSPEEIEGELVVR